MKPEPMRAGDADSLSPGGHGNGTASRVAVACGVGMAVSIQPIFIGTFSLYLQPASANFSGGLSVFSQVPLIAALVSAAAGPFIGRAADRGAAVPLLLVGAAALAAGLFGLSLARSILTLQVCAVLIGLGGALAGPIVYSKLIIMHVKRAQAVLMGAVLGASPAVAGALAVHVAAFLIDRYGWQSAYAVSAAVAGGLTMVAGLILARGGGIAEKVLSSDAAIAMNDRPAGLTLWQALRDRNAQLLCAATLLAILMFGALNGHLLAWLAERGHSHALGVWVVSAVALVGVAGPIVGGFLLDRTGSPMVTLSFVGLPIVGLLVMWLATMPSLVILGAAMIGLGMSALVGLLPLLVAGFCGARASAEIFGVLFGAAAIGIGLGTQLGAVLYDIRGNYELVTMLMLCLLGGAFVCLLLLGKFRFEFRKPDQKLIQGDC